MNNNQQNPFNAIHTTADGEQMMIVSMEDSHLLNMIRLLLVKKPAEYVDKQRSIAYRSYAAEQISTKTSKFLGLKSLSPEEKAIIENTLEEYKAGLEAAAFQHAIPYLFVALTRESTCEEAKEIVQELTGIYGQVKMHRMISDALPSGSDWEGYDDDDDEHDLPF